MLQHVQQSITIQVACKSDCINLSAKDMVCLDSTLISEIKVHLLIINNNNY